MLLKASHIVGLFLCRFLFGKSIICTAGKHNIIKYSTFIIQ